MLFRVSRMVFICSLVVIGELTEGLVLGMCLLILVGKESLEINESAYLRSPDNVRAIYMFQYYVMVKYQF